jgi:hypothetical protein
MSELSRIELSTFVLKHVLTQPLGDYYKCTPQAIFYIFISQLLKFYKIKFETAKPCFLQ